MLQLRCTCTYRYAVTAMVAATSSLLSDPIPTFIVHKFIDPRCYRASEDGGCQVSLAVNSCTHDKEGEPTCGNMGTVQTAESG